jgi:hypothetical protein
MFYHVNGIPKCENNTSVGRREDFEQKRIFIEQKDRFAHKNIGCPMKYNSAP